jgi:peptide methionine sulfoxide reductase MsrA
MTLPVTLTLPCNMLCAASATTAIAVFGCGCFWCSDAVFKSVRGVLNVTCGYLGGSEPRPSYQQVKPNLKQQAGP